MEKSLSLLDPTRKKPPLVLCARELGACAGVLLPESDGESRGWRDAGRPRSASSMMGSPSSKMVPGSSVRRGEGEGMMPSGLGCATYSIVASDPSTRRFVAWSSTSLRERRVSSMRDTPQERPREVSALLHLVRTHAGQLQFGVEWGWIRVEEGVDGEGERVEEATTLRAEGTVSTSAHSEAGRDSGRGDAPRRCRKAWT